MAGAVLLLAGCNPHMYDEVPGVSDVRRSELTGTWRCVEGTRVELKPDGTAVITRLDGQEWDFYDRWRLSGTGTWSLTDDDVGWSDGQHVRLRLDAPASREERADAADATLDDDGGPAPERYTWTLELGRHEKGLVLFFLHGDPDSRSTYVLEPT